MTRTIVVVDFVQPQQEGIAQVTQLCQPLHVCSNGIEDVAMRHVVTLAVTFVNEVLYNADVVESKGHQTVQKVIVVAPHIDNLRSLFLHHLHDNFEELRMACLPLAGAPLA